MGGERSRRRLGSAVEVAPGTHVDKFEIFFDLVFVARDATLRAGWHDDRPAPDAGP